MTLKYISIGEIVDQEEASIQTGPFGTQLKASHYTEVGWPVINVRNVGYGDLRPEKLEFINDETRDRLSVHVLEEQDIVFGRKGAVDRHLFVQSAQSGWLQGSDCIRLRFSSPRIEPRFVSYAFLTKSHQSWMLTQSGNKATMASLNQDIIKRIEIPNFPLPIQTRIADILSAYDDLIENNKRRMQLLEEAARQLYREWFVRLRFPGHEHTRIVDGLPEGWEKPSAFDCLNIMSGGTPKTTVPGYWDGEIPFYTPKDAVDGIWVTGCERTITEEGLNKCNSRLYRKGTVFISARGTVGKLNIAQRPMAMSQSCYALEGRSRISDFFLYSAMKAGVEELKQQAVGAVFDAIIVDTFKRIPFLLPTASIREAFEDSTTPIFHQIENLTLQNQKLRAARDLLLPKLMNGEIAI